MEGKLKTPLKRVDYVTHARITKIQDVSAFETLYSITFYATLYENPETLEIEEYSIRKEVDVSEHKLDPLFVSMLRKGIDDPAYLDTPAPEYGGFTPNQILQTKNDKFVNYMKGLNLEFESIAL